MKLCTALLLSALGSTAAFAPSIISKPTSSTALNVVLTKNTGRSALDPTVIDKYDALTFPDDKILAEYVWVDAVGNTRSKTRTLPVDRAANVESLPKWNFDGSSTGQAPGDDSEVILRPCRIFRDPFRPRSDGLQNILVMCDTWTPAGEALPSNTRAYAESRFQGNEDKEFWFGLEQEYTLFNLDERTPLGWPQFGFPSRAQGPYYCSVGPENSFGRHITDAMYKAALYAGINISGTNGEVMPGQQEYQVGPCVGLDAGDQLMMSRYILQRVCEDFQVYCTLDPKPITDGDWNGAGMHTNISTKAMREEGGIEEIRKAIYKLGAKHKEHIALYGTGNEKRLTGKHETASIDQFSFGIANRGASVRIGRDTEAEGKGYFEDRRPASNADPYLVIGKICETVCEDVDAPVIAPKDKESA
jgi:glutamine synthetase